MKVLWGSFHQLKIWPEHELMPEPKNSFKKAANDVNLYIVIQKRIWDPNKRVWWNSLR